MKIFGIILKLQNQLIQEYGDTSYSLQFQEEISKLSISSKNNFDA